jgi:hypothetical protein
MKKLVILEGYNTQLGIVGRIANVRRAVKNVRSGVKNVRAFVQNQRGAIQDTAQQALQQQAAQVAELQRLARAAEMQQQQQQEKKINPLYIAAGVGVLGIGAAAVLMRGKK